MNTIHFSRTARRALTLTLLLSSTPIVAPLTAHAASASAPAKAKAPAKIPAKVPATTPAKTAAPAKAPTAPVAPPEAPVAPVDPSVAAAPEAPIAPPEPEVAAPTPTPAPALVAPVVRTIDPAQTSALQDALKKNDMDAARAAVNAGADVNVVGKDGATILMKAAAAQQADFVNALLQDGADPNAADKKGSTALHYAVPEGSQPKKKKRFGGMFKALAGAALSGAVGGGLGNLGGLAGNPLGSALLGGTPLDSLMGGNLTSLLSGSPFSLAGKSGWTAIAGAALQGDAGGKLGVASLLGGGNSMLNAGGWTSLLSSAKTTNPQILSAMSNLGAGAPNSALWSQFLTAASSGDQASVETLMKKPELNGLLQQASAGLNEAANDLPGNVTRNVIDALVKKGARTDATNKDGQTPADLAKERGLNDLVPLLGGKPVPAQPANTGVVSNDLNNN